jgi:dynein heavy chain
MLQSTLQMNPQLIQFCNADGQEVRLRVILKELESCQKALNEYLDMKKSIFPRFYFVSNVALLDILRYGYELRIIANYCGSTEWGKH